MQAWQIAPQAALQQTPSTQKPDPQSVACMHTCPLAFLQACAPSQALFPMQGLLPLGSCWPAGTFEQTPRLPGTAQERQTPVQFPLQQ